MSTTLLQIKNLTVDYVHDHRAVSAVRDVSLDIHEGTTLGLVGESGCGKSTLALALMGLLPERESRTPYGQILFRGNNLLNNSREEMRKLRGAKISMIFQDPFSSLNPVMSIKEQIMEIFEMDETHPSTEKASVLLEEVQLLNPERILNSYPHQLSGGQRQRIMIAMALARRPDLLIADEPTTALDVLVQDEIVKLLATLQQEKKMAMLFVTHNMGLIKTVAHETAVMYAGEIVEQGDTAAVLSNPKHPYTQGLLRSLPTLKHREGPLPMLEGQPPEPGQIPSGCPFHPRCEKIFDPCRTQDPKARSAADHLVKCHLY